MGPIGKAHWLRIEVENLPNGEEIACATLWIPPNPFDGVSVEDMQVVQKVAQGGAFRTDSQSPQWLGWWMAENLPHLNIRTRHGDKPKNKAEVARLNSILAIWKKNNVLQIEEREDEHRKKRRFFIAGDCRHDHPTNRIAPDDDDDFVLQ